MWGSTIEPKGHAVTLLTKKLILRRGDKQVRARGVLTAVV
jgi:hypothetical protein